MFNIKKVKYLLIGIIIGSLTSASFVMAEPTVKLIVNGVDITHKSEVPPQIINGRTLVPVRALAESLGAEVTWDNNTQTVVVTSKNNSNPQQKSITNNNPLKILEIGETTYETLSNSDEKRAYITVKISNTSDKYIEFIRLKPMLNINNGKNYTSAIVWDKSDITESYFPPNKTVNITYWTDIPFDAKIIKWEY